MTFDILQYGLELGTIGVAAWSRVEAARAKAESREANRHSQTIQRAVQPNGETLIQILKELREISKANRELLRHLVLSERYTHRRNHKILNGVYRVALGNSAILRKMGVEIPDPEPPLPDALDSDDGDLDIGL